MKAISVLSPNRFGKILAADTKNVSRDPILMFAIILSVLPALLFVWFRQTINDAALPAFGIANFATYLTPVVLALPAALIGWVTGFLILEDRDDGPLLALDITPLGKAGFVLHRATVTFCITFLISVVAIPYVLPQSQLVIALFLALFVALQSVILAFLLPAIARNKVEGLAVTKVLNISAIIPVLAVMPSPLRYLGGFIPTYWLGELMDLSTTTYLSTPAIIILGLICHILVLWLVYHLLTRRIG